MVVLGLSLELHQIITECKAWLVPSVFLSLQFGLLTPFSPIISSLMASFCSHSNPSPGLRKQFSPAEPRYMASSNPLHPDGKPKFQATRPLSPPPAASRAPASEDAQSDGGSHQLSRSPTALVSPSPRPGHRTEMPVLSAEHFSFPGAGLCHS